MASERERLARGPNPRERVAPPAPGERCPRCHALAGSRACMLCAPELVPPEAKRDPVEKQLMYAIVHGDDTARLVYADWLEARGLELRAEAHRTLYDLRTCVDFDPTLETRLHRLANRLTTEGVAGLALEKDPILASELGWLVRTIPSRQDILDLMADLVASLRAAD